MAALGCLLPSSPACAVLMSSSWPEDARTVNRAPVLSGRGSASSGRTSRTGSLLDEISSRTRIAVVNRRASKLGPPGLDRQPGARRITVSLCISAALVLQTVVFRFSSFMCHNCVVETGFCSGEGPPENGGPRAGLRQGGISCRWYGPSGNGFHWILAGISAKLSCEMDTKTAARCSFCQAYDRADLVVALTIDDGPNEDITPELLDILKENQSRATFFIVGHNMDRCPQLVERMHREGHEVGNHTMFDEPSWRLSPADFEQQLVAVDNRLNKYYCQDNDGNMIKWFRPGYGLFSNSMVQIAKTHGYRTALGSLFPFDNLFTSQDRLIAQYLLWRVYPGAVIVLHDREPQKQQTAKVLRKLLPGLRRRGYSIGSLTDLLNLRGNSQ